MILRFDDTNPSK